MALQARKRRLVPPEDPERLASAFDRREPVRAQEGEPVMRTFIAWIMLSLMIVIIGLNMVRIAALKLKDLDEGERTKAILSIIAAALLNLMIFFGILYLYISGE